MSGSGGGIPYIASATKNCENLSIITRLSSPDPLVIAKINQGDILQIVHRSPTAPIYAITEDGDIAGSILNKDMAKLAECIKSGTEYAAEVLKIDGGNCQVKIKSI